MSPVDLDSDEMNAVQPFWDVYATNRRTRLEVLQRLSRVVVPRGPDWDKAVIRAESCAVTLDKTNCGVCANDDVWLYEHHIIQIQHGGSNMVRNIVPICHACHREVHPWLPKGNSLENKTWRKLDDLVVRWANEWAESQRKRA